MCAMCDPMCCGCLLSVFTPLLFKDCEKCKSILKEGFDCHDGKSKQTESKQAEH